MSEVIEGYDLSIQQERIWAARAARHVEAQALLAITGPHSAEEVRAALTAICDRHEIFRTRFVTPSGLSSPLQVIDDVAAWNWTELDLSGLPDAEQTARIDVEAHRCRAAGLASTAVLFTLAPESRALLVTLDPLRVDRATFTILAAEMGALLGGAGLDDTEPLPYGGFAEWQRSRLSGAEPPAVPMLWPVGVTGGDVPGYHVIAESFPADVRAYAAAAGFTVEAVLVAAFQVLLSRSVGGDAVEVGIPVSGRFIEDLATSCGPFAFAAAVTAPVAPGRDFSGLVREVAARAASARADADTLAAAPACVVAVAEPGDDAEPDGAVSVAWAVVRTGLHDLWLDLRWDRAGVLRSTWEYDGARLHEAYVRVLAERYGVLLAALVGAADRPVHDHDLLGPEERRILLDEFNRSEPVQPPDLVHRLFRQQAAAHPDRIAVATDDGDLTYRQLDDLSDRLAARLRRDGVGPETLVGVGLGHVMTLPVALLAVLKSGAAYVPVDVTLPEHRSALLLIGCTVLICADDRPFDGIRHRLDDVGELEHDDAGHGEAETEPRLDGLAYVMYTSGSTGTPKGVMVTHRGLANYLLWSNETYLGGSAGIAVAHSPIGFDLTVTSLLTPLMAGGTVRLLPGADRNPAVLAGALLGHPDIDLVKLTPAHLRILNQELTARGTPVPGRKTFVVGGEALTGDLIAPWHGSRIINEYGPTEAVVGCVIHDVPAGSAGDGPVRIGRPAPNTVIYVLGDDLRPAGVGVPGEIYIGGVQLARGYLDAPGLTAERFVPDPFSPDGGRLYRTGDIACHLPGGDLRFLGRVDDQVKIRGVRVEPGELEAVLRQHPAVGDAAVVTSFAEVGASLTAFVTAAGPGLRAAEIDAYLTERVPAHLQPAAVSVVEAIPLTASGKVDAQALRDTISRTPAEAPASSDVAPIDEFEATLAEIFENLVNRAPVGRHEGFFDIGGHSLLAVQLMFRIDERFGCSIPVSILFDIDQPGMATVAGLAAVIRSKTVRSEPAPAAGVIRLRTGGDRAPLFLLPPAGGELLGYRDLVERLEVSRPVYALEVVAVNADEDGSTVTQLGDHYANVIRSVTPDGPCSLAGWSFGGVTAYETARSLRRTGHDVEHLVLIDAYPDIPPRSAATLAGDFAEELGYIHGVPLSLDIDPDDPTSVDGLLARVFAAAGAAGIEVAGTAALRRMFLLYRAHAVAAAAYRPQVQPGRLVLIQPADAPLDNRVGALRRWESLVDTVAHHIVGGDHYTMLGGYRADELAKVLRTVLEATATAR